MKVISLKERNKAIFSYVCSIAFLAIFWLNSSVYVYKYTPTDVFFLISSIIICILSLYSILMHGIKTYNLFFLTFYFFLFLNSLHISKLQSSMSFIDIYYIIFGSLVFGLFLYFGETIRIIGFKKYKFININLIYLLLIVIYVLISGYIYFTVGYRILDTDTLYRYQNKDLYVVAGVSGLHAILMWTILILCPHVKRSLSQIGIITILLTSILQINRGNIVRIMMFLILLYLIKHRITYKTVFATLMTLAILLMVFTYAGEVRQADSNNPFSIGNSLHSNVSNEYINWLYAYSAVNFEVLKNIAEDHKPEYYPNTILMPINRLAGDNYKSSIEFLEELGEYSVGGGFNASTFLSTFIFDYGNWYFVELILFSCLLGILIILAKYYQLTGVYIFITMLTTLTIFGNYYTLVPFFYSTILSMFLLICSKNTGGSLIAKT